MNCPYSTSAEIMTADSFEHETGVYCKLTPDEDESWVRHTYSGYMPHKLVAADDWNVEKYTDVPDWCPLVTKEFCAAIDALARLIELDEKYLPCHEFVLDFLDDFFESLGKFRWDIPDVDRFQTLLMACVTALYHLVPRGRRETAKVAIYTFLPQHVCNAVKRHEDAVFSEYALLGNKPQAFNAAAEIALHACHIKTASFEPELETFAIVFEETREGSGRAGKADLVFEVTKENFGPAKLREVWLHIERIRSVLQSFYAIPPRNIHIVVNGKVVKPSRILRGKKAYHF